MKRILTLPILAIVAAATPRVGADDLQPLGDEFNDAASIAQWRNIAVTEGWVANQLEQWDINTNSPGMMRMTPYTSSWFNHLRGVLIYKDVSGDFVCTTRLRVRSRHDPGNPDAVPNRTFTLAGIFAHRPRGAGYRGAPDPYTTAEFPVQGGAPVWPYPGSGSTWAPGTEDYLFVSFGATDAPGIRKYEVKATRNSNSVLYYNNLTYGGQTIPNTAEYAWVELQMVRVGETVVALRRHPDGAGGWGPWIVENRFPNAYQTQFPFPGPDVQLGITTYTDWNSISNSYWLGNSDQTDFLRQWRHNYTQLVTGQHLYGGQPHQPDLITDVEYVRYERPHPAVTEAALQAMATTFVSQGEQSVQLLPPEGVGQYLGDAANTPLGTVAFESTDFTANEHAGTAEMVVARMGASLDRALTVNYTVTGGSATAGDDFTPVSGTLTWEANDTAAKSIAVPIIADSLAEGAETVVVTLSGLNGPATFPASVPDLQAVLTIEDSPFDQWRLEQFGEAANSPDAQADADPDGDQLTNAAEFALVGNPLAADTAPLPVAGRNGNRLTLTFSRPTTMDGLTYIVQGTNDLAGEWEYLATKTGAGEWTAAEGVEVDDPGTGAVVVTDRAVAGGGSRFLRLRMLLAP